VGSDKESPLIPLQKGEISEAAGNLKEPPFQGGSDSGGSHDPTQQQRLSSSLQSCCGCRAVGSDQESPLIPLQKGEISEAVGNLKEPPFQGGGDSGGSHDPTQQQRLSSSLQSCCCCRAVGSDKESPLIPLQKGEISESVGNLKEPPFQGGSDSGGSHDPTQQQRLSSSLQSCCGCRAVGSDKESPLIPLQKEEISESAGNLKEPPFQGGGDSGGSHDPTQQQRLSSSLQSCSRP